MYYHFPIEGEAQQISDEVCLERKKSISSQWEDETTPFGKLYMGVFDWAYTGVEIHIPKLRTGGEIPLNEKASKFFGFKIYGDCFLKPIEKEVPNIDKVIPTL